MLSNVALLLSAQVSSSDGHSGSFQRIESFVLVHSKEPVLPAPKWLFRLSKTFIEVDKE